MADDFIIDVNRLALKALYEKAKGHETLLPYKDLFKLFTSTHINPDLLDIYALKTLVVDVAKTNGDHNKKPDLSYLEFEALLVDIANKAFAKHESPDKFKLLLDHIAIACRLLYGVHVKSSLNSEVHESIRSSEANSVFYNSCEKFYEPDNALKNFLSSSQSFQKLRNDSNTSLRKTTTVWSPKGKNAPIIKRSVTAANLPSSPKQRLRSLIKLSPKPRPNEDPVNFDQFQQKSETVKKNASNPFIKTTQCLTSAANNESQSIPDDKREKMLSLLNDFKINHEKSIGKRVSVLGPKVISFIKSTRDKRLNTVISKQKYVLKLHFEIWKLKVLVNGYALLNE